MNEARYRVLVVDDEKLIARGIAKNVACTPANASTWSVSRLTVTLGRIQSALDAEQ